MIGVILMVAITVILAAVIASFVFGLGAKAPKSAPSAQLSLSDAKDTLDDSTNDVLTISHQGGDSLSWNQTKVLIYDDSGNLIAELKGANTAADGFNLTESEPRFTPGEIAKFIETDAGNTTISTGDVLQVKVLDTQSNQPILDGEVQVW